MPIKDEVTPSGLHVRRFVIPRQKRYPQPKGSQRNQKCPCGSGKKWKRCHG